jgi:hypothetical protein
MDSIVAKQACFILQMACFANFKACSESKMDSVVAKQACFIFKMACFANFGACFKNDLEALAKQIGLFG